MNYVGDFPTGATVYLLWNTNGQDGASITRATDGTLKIYKNVSATERTSLAGVVQVEDFDAATGVHSISIDLSDNTDAGFYVAGGEYHVVMTGMVIDTKTVNAEIAHFSIERPGGVLALLKNATYGLSALSARIPTALTANGFMKSSFVELITTALTETATGRLKAALTTMFDVATPVLTTASVNQTGDAYGRIGAAGAGLTAVGDTRMANLDATISSRLAPAGTLATVTSLTNAPTVGDWNATMKSSLTTALANLDVAVSSRLAPSGTLAAVTTATNLTNAPTAGDLTATMKASITASVPTAASNAAAVGARVPTESYAALYAVPTYDQLLIMMLQLLSERGIVGTIQTTRRLDGATPAMTHLLNSPTTPTDITRNS